MRPAILIIAWFLTLTGAGFTATTRAARVERSVSLAGEWGFALDRQDRGIAERWYDRSLQDRIQLPGSLQAQGYGDEVTATTQWMGTLHDTSWHLRKEYQKHAQPGQVRTPFLLQPQRHYLGAAWYQRAIDVPTAWRDRRIVLTLERPHWQTQVWLDDRPVGTCDALGTPHEYDLGVAQPGRHTLTIRVDNRMIIDVGRNAHSVTDYTQSAWNGIVGRIALDSTSLVWLDDVQAFPNVAERSVRIEARIGNATGSRGSGRLIVDERSQPVTWDEHGGATGIEIVLGEQAQLWDEFHPVLTRLRIRLAGGQADDEREVAFGLREIGVDGTQFTLNGRRIYLRGTHEGCSFPLTGYPPSDVESWRRIFRIAQAHGLNHVRFHSWCPPEAAFAAADELGIYVQPECSIWARDDARLDPGSPLETWLYAESERMMKAYGNHPSFVLLTHGNEPEGRWTESLPRWVEHCKERDPRRLYAACSGWPMRHSPGEVVGTQFYVISRIGRSRVRGMSGWAGKDHRAAVEGANVPIVTHELGQHSAYPGFEEIRKYTGLLRPENYEIFRDSLAAHGLLSKAHDFVMASGRLQVLAYKEDVEACLRTPGHAGFQLLDLHDYPGQGTSPVGVLDVFWDPKEYVTAEEYRRFCNSTVPLARLHRRTFTQKEPFSAEIEVAHFGAAPLDAAVAAWKIIDTNGAIVSSGELPPQAISIGNAIRLGAVEVDLAPLAAPRAYTFVVGLKGTRFENDWNFWVYPERADTAPPEDVSIASAIDGKTLKTLAAGGKVLLLPKPDQLAWDSPPFGFAPIFWNRQLYPRWDRPLGILCDPSHPALAEFPTSFHMDWQWESLLQPECRAINIGSLPAQLTPIVQAIDDWNRNYRLALLFESRVLAGKLLVSAFDLTTNAETLPSKRQLLKSLLDYMASERFMPTVTVKPEQIGALFFDSRVMSRFGAEATATAETRGNEARNLVDGDPNTFWRTPATGSGQGYPHEVIISFAQAPPLTGLIVMAQQHDRKRIGEIRDFVFKASVDGQEWREIARGTLAPTYEPQRVPFQPVVTARHLKLTFLSCYDGGATAALAEIAVVVDRPM